MSRRGALALMGTALLLAGCSQPRGHVRPSPVRIEVIVAAGSIVPTVTGCGPVGGDQLIVTAPSGAPLAVASPSGSPKCLAGGLWMEKFSVTVPRERAYGFSTGEGGAQVTYQKLRQQHFRVAIYGS